MRNSVWVSDFTSEAGGWGVVGTPVAEAHLVSEDAMCVSVTLVFVEILNSFSAAAVPTVVCLDGHLANHLEA